MADRLGIHATPTFVALIDGEPPVSASERGLPVLLNSPVVTSQLIQARAATVQKAAAR